MVVDDDRQRPHRRVPRARGAVDPALRARRVRPPPARARRKPASSTSCSARSPRRSSSTASRSSTAPPAPRRSPGSRTFLAAQHAARAGHAARRASRCCSSASGSRSRRCRSTCGRPTSTRARPRRSPRSWRRPPRPPASPRCSACSCVAFPLYRDDWRPAVVGARGAHARRSAASAPCVQTDVKRDARVLVDRARRLRAHRVRRPRTPHAAGEAVALLPLRLHVHVDRRVRGRHRARRSQGDDDHSIDELPRPRAPTTRARRPARRSSCSRRRHPAHRWVHRQARGVRGRGRRAASTALAIDRRASPPWSPRSSTCGSSWSPCPRPATTSRPARPRRLGRRVDLPDRASCSRSPPAMTLVLGIAARRLPRLRPATPTLLMHSSPESEPRDVAGVSGADQRRRDVVAARRRLAASALVERRRRRGGTPRR